MKDEIRAAISKMKLGEATGPDSISVELLERLDDYRIGEIATLLTEMYGKGQIPQDVYKSIHVLIALPKMQEATNVNY